MSIIKRLVDENENTIITDCSTEAVIDKTIHKLKIYLTKLRSGKIHNPDDFEFGTTHYQNASMMIENEIKAVEDCIVNLEKTKHIVSSAELYNKTLVHTYTHNK